MSSAQDPPIGCKADTGIDFIKLVPIAPTIIGDPVMKLYGVYGGPAISVTSSAIWYRPL